MPLWTIDYDDEPDYEGSWAEQDEKEAVPVIRKRWTEEDDLDEIKEDKK